MVLRLMLWVQESRTMVCLRALHALVLGKKERVWRELKDVRGEGLQDLSGSEGVVVCRAGAVHLVLEGSSHDTFNDAVMLVALRFRSAMNYVRSFKKVRLVETLM